MKFISSNYSFHKLLFRQTLFMLIMEENKKKQNKKKRTRQRGVNVYKNITKSNDTLVKRLLMLKNELIFDIPMLCLYALWFCSYFNEIEEENLL